MLTAHPRVLVLDEPTSALDPTAAEEVLAALTRLVHDLGITVVMAEHRLERVVQYADRMVLLDRRRRVGVGEPADDAGALAGRAAGRRARPLAGWPPLPLSRPRRPPAAPDPATAWLPTPAPAPAPAAAPVLDRPRASRVRYGRTRRRPRASTSTCAPARSSR